MIYYYNIIMLCAVELNVVIYMRKKKMRDSYGYTRHM